MQGFNLSPALISTINELQKDSSQRLVVVYGCNHSWNYLFSYPLVWLSILWNPEVQRPKQKMMFLPLKQREIELKRDSTLGLTHQPHLSRHTPSHHPLFLYPNTMNEIKTKICMSGRTCSICGGPGCLVHYFWRAESKFWIFFFFFFIIGLPRLTC